MKTKFRYLTFLAVSLFLGFTSCSNDDATGGEENNEPKSLFLKISNGDIATYGTGPTVVDNADIDFSGGIIYFVNSDGMILKHYTLTVNATSETNINFSDIQDGTTIENLPGGVSSVHVVGNYTGSPSLITSGNISAVTNKVLTVASQHDIENVNLYGTNTIVSVGPTEPNKYTCAINLRPTVARIELTDITASGVITSFKVDGIFIDNYYSQATINSTLEMVNLQDNGTTSGDFVGGSTVYPASLTPAIYDYYTSPLESASKVVALADDDVWRYSLFARQAGSEIPRIIIRLSEIETTPESNITISGTRFITIRGFKSGSTSLSVIKSGEIYNIGAGDLVFDESNLAITPNEAKIEVEVTIALAKWKVVPITPEL
ncbi:MAG TPA: hypothetical protein PKC55_07930 [Dysgonomonas sp.]|uniref:hypothetical protein n=1 Tax=unclassified Dysgonomonas TaxID=2630389 RepID=UPI0025C314C5|nr:MULTISPECIES: hypothetical protein [unclassified Dysgonomonas]HML64738.1 hypothetical protein [Dysgonomonas sp.]